MKKLLLITSLFLCVPQAIHSMNLVPYQSNFFVYSDMMTDDRKPIYIEMFPEVAKTVPFFNKTMQDGWSQITYSHAQQQDLNNFSTYSLNRSKLQDGSNKLACDKIENETTEFLTKLDVTSLCRLTIMAADMYGEKFPKGFFDVWSMQINAGRKGKGEILPFFQEREELGGHIFVSCWETADRDNMNGSILPQQNQGTAQDDLDGSQKIIDLNEKNDKPMGFFMNVKAFLGSSYMKPVWGLAAIGVLCAMYKMMQKSA